MTSSTGAAASVAGDWTSTEVGALNGRAYLDCEGSNSGAAAGASTPTPTEASYAVLGAHDIYAATAATFGWLRSEQGLGQDRSPGSSSGNGVTRRAAMAEAADSGGVKGANNNGQEAQRCLALRCLGEMPPVSPLLPASLPHFMFVAYRSALSDTSPNVRATAAIAACASLARMESEAMEAGAAIGRTWKGSSSSPPTRAYRRRTSTSKDAPRNLNDVLAEAQSPPLYTKGDESLSALAPHRFRRADSDRSRRRRIVGRHFEHGTRRRSESDASGALRVQIDAACSRDRGLGTSAGKSALVARVEATEQGPVEIDWSFWGGSREAGEGISIESADISKEAAKTSTRAAPSYCRGDFTSAVLQEDVKPSNELRSRSVHTAQSAPRLRHEKNCGSDRTTSTLIGASCAGISGGDANFSGRAPPRQGCLGATADASNISLRCWSSDREPLVDEPLPSLRYIPLEGAIDGALSGGGARVLFHGTREPWSDQPVVSLENHTRECGGDHVYDRGEHSGAVDASLSWEGMLPVAAREELLDALLVTSLQEPASETKIQVIKVRAGSEAQPSRSLIARSGSADCRRWMRVVHLPP